MKKTTISDLFNKKVEYGGEIRTYGSVRKELEEKEFPSQLIDYYMMGLLTMMERKDSSK